MDFLLGGTAAMGACIFSNPMEVLKTRLQLQGELQAKGQHAVHYKNVFHAGYVVAKNDGILALQKGLVPALWVQLVMNGIRLGVYGLADSAGHLRDQQGNLIFFKALLITGAGSATGQFLSSPFFLVKTHLQAQAVAIIAVGHQHNHEGSFKALTNIYKANGECDENEIQIIGSVSQDNWSNLIVNFDPKELVVKIQLKQTDSVLPVSRIKGIFRGSSATIPRSFLGGASQLIGFDYAKQFIDDHNVTNIPILKSFLASMVGGVAVSTVVTPFDLISTRLYNQPTDASGKGVWYKSYFDCVHKIYKSEGLLAFYKGLGPMYLRLGPHTVLCLVFFDELRSLYNRYFIRENIIRRNI